MVGAVYGAASSGDRRSALEAIRDHLARELESTEGPAAAVLSKELRATIAELDALPGGREADPVDDLSARRAARRSAAAGGDVPESGQQRGT
ncbi:hypothetical protein ACFYST_06115 [Kitasatospora sp. NPDC004614]|uniref:hypothetical protein n=1 Tax=unclassified Kitasatospora TaxID=2633591 RepID=UPI00367B813E